MRELAVEFGSDMVKFISVDDKAKIKIGEPETPLALTVRGRPVFQERDNPLSSSDHDMGIKI